MNDIDQKLLNVINVQGILLQEKCSKIFSDKGWSVATEYPVIYPKPAFGGLGKECVIDLWGKKQLAELELNFFVECKKANPKLKNWIFFVDQFNQSTGTDVIRLWQMSEGKWKTETSLQDFRERIKAALNLKSENTSFWGLETKENFTKAPQKDDTITSTDRIINAAYQATQATNGSFGEYGEYLAKLGESSLTKEPKTVLLIPMIVTTANLLEAEYDPKNIDENGEILDVKNISFKEKEIIFYSYPVPGHIRFSMVEENIPKMSLESRLGYKRTLVMVVNIKFLPKLLDIK